MTRDPQSPSNPPPPPPPMAIDWSHPPDHPPQRRPAPTPAPPAPDFLERTRRRLGEERPTPQATPGGSWMEAAVRGRWEAAGVSLVAAWTPLAALIWVLGMGLILALLAGLLLSSFVPAVAVLVGIPLVAVPLLLDHLGTLVSAVTGGVLVGGIVALALTRTCLALEPALLRLRGARPLSDRESRRLTPLLAEVTRRLGLTTGPRLLIDDSEQPHAYTMPATIVLSRALVASMTDAQLAAVLAHELGHWQRGDAIADRFLLCCALPVAMTYRIFLCLAQLRGFVAVFAWILFWPAVVIVRLVLEPITARGRRESEFLADANAVRAGLGQGMYDALHQLGATSLEGARNGWELAMLHSHPPNEFRLDAIRHAAPEVREAPYS